MADAPKYIDSAEVVITGAETADNTVSADILLRLLSGMQQSVLLVAAAAENVILQKRFRPSEELKLRYRLVVDVQRPGSYAVPLKLASSVTQMALLEQPRQGVLSTVRDILGAVATNDRQTIQSLLPDSRFRDRLLREISHFMPKRGELWGIDYRTDD